MAPGVAADLVPCGDDLPHQRRLCLRVAADEKEGRMNLAAGQNVEQTRRPGGIGTVVKGER